MQWPAQRIEKGTSCALGGGTEERIAAETALIDDCRLPHRTVGIDCNPDLDDEVRVAVDPDGTVRQAIIVDQGRLGSDPFFRAAAESARRAFFNPLCRPLRLPPEKYAIWKDLVVDFSPKDIL